MMRRTGDGQGSMRITGVNRPAVATATGGARRGDGGQVFAPSTPSGGGAPAAAATSAGGSLAGLEALLALQGVPADRPNRQKTLRRGHDVLDVLEELKLGLLGGPVTGAALDRLAGLLRDGRDDVPDDPGLAALMADIELRAMVELAKNGRFVD